MRFISTLKQALTLYYLVAATLPLLLFAFFTFNFANDYLRRDVLKTNADLVQVLHEQTQSFLMQRRLILEHIGNIIFKERLVAGHDIDRYLHDELASDDYFDAVFFVNSSGQVLHAAARNRAVSLEAMRGIDLSQHELYLRYQGQAPLGWSGSHVSPLGGMPSISYGMKSGDLLLIGTISLEHISRLVDRLDAAGGLRSDLHLTDSKLNFALVDRQGSILAHSDADTMPPPENLSSHASIVAALEQGEDTRIEEDAGQLMVETAALVPETGWVVWVARDFNAAMAPLFHMRNLFFIVVCGAVILAVVSVLLTARKLMQPLRGLLEDVRLLAAGEPITTDKAESYYEIDELSTGFRRLVSDVHEREMALLSGERRFRSLVNSVEGMVFEATLPDLVTTFVSERSEAVTGFTPDEWLSAPDFWSRRLHPDDRQWAADYRATQSRLGQPFQFEYRLRHKDGRIRWLREMASVVAEEGGAPRLLGVAIDITASKEAELSLQESEQRFRSLVEQAADAIFIHNMQGELLDVNEQACRSLGYSRLELQGMSIADIERIQSPLQFSSLWNSVQRGGSLTFEAEHQRKDGSSFPVEIRLGSFQYQEQPMLLALVRDITDRKRALLALRESEERYRSVVSAMTEGVLLTDADGVVIAANPAMDRIFNLPHTQILKQSLTKILPEFIDEDGAPISPDKMPERQTWQTGKPTRNELLARICDGQPTVWLEVNTQPIFHFGDTGVAGVVTTFTDVTDRKEALEALRHSEEQVRLLLNSTAEGIFGLDLQGCCIFCNPAALRLLGYETERDLLGKSFHSLLCSYGADDSPVESAATLLQRVFAQNVTVHSDDEQFWRADGGSFDVEYWGHPIIKDGETVGAVVTFHDITERKRMQQQTIRNAQLASLGELAAGVAHEINNPVSGVINYAQILLNRAQKNGDETELVGRIIHEGERIATIVRDMLFFAREGSGEMYVTRLADLLQDAISLSAAQLRKEGIVLHTDIPADLPPLRVRAQQIQQLFLNLLSNARHALREKYPGSDPDKLIEVTAQQVDSESGPRVKVVVEDHGVGISEKILPRVMNPFVTTKPAGVGTGLGLSISHEIVKQHGGEIRIESREGEMTRVIVELPVAKGRV